MPTPPSPITIPSALVYRSTPGRNTPLTNLELDQNFAYVENLAELRLPVSQFTSTQIISKLNSDSQSSSAGGINSFLLRGFAPNDGTVASTLVLRDSTGSFSANTITATTFSGNATNATLAQSAVKLQTPRTINGVAFDGTANITINDSTRVAKTGDTMTGKLTTLTSSSSSASIRLPHGVTPTAPVDGDIWSTTSGLFARIGGITYQFATLQSNINGYAANISGVAQIANGGTGANNADIARSNLSAAKSGLNSDITRITGLTTPLSINQGGTGLTSPGAEGNILKSDGSKWVSVADSTGLKFMWGYNLGVSNYKTSPMSQSSNECYYDIFPPVGYTMAQFAGVAVSPAYLSSGLSGQTQVKMWCTWEKWSDRIRITCSTWNNQVTPRINYFAIWKNI